VDLAAEDNERVERARARWRRNQAKWRERHEDRKDSR
jgi:hypothetical protein